MLNPMDLEGYDDYDAPTNETVIAGVKLTKERLFFVAVVIIAFMVICALLGVITFLAIGSNDSGEGTTTPKTQQQTCTKTQTLETQFTPETPVTTTTTATTATTQPIEQPITPTTKPDTLDAEEEALYEEIMNWQNVFEASHAGKQALSDDENSMEVKYYKDCLATTKAGEWFRAYADPTCNLLWLRVLENAKVESVYDMKPVVTMEEQKAGVKNPDGKNHPNGGFVCNLEGGSKMYWKPCYGNTGEKSGMHGSVEHYYSEIISYHIDRLLGFYRVPPVAPRHHSTADLSAWGTALQDKTNPHYDKDGKWKVETQIKHCGDKDGMEGASVGWSPVAVKDITGSSKYSNLIMMGRVSQTEVDELNELYYKKLTKDSPYKDLKLPLESVTFFMFGAITGLVDKMKHNVFAMCNASMPTQCGADPLNFGPYAYVDNDRTQWKHATLGFDNEFKSDIALPTFCRFPRDISKRILLLEKKGISLSSLVTKSTSIYTVRHGPLWTKEQSKILDKNVEHIRSVIKKCIADHGEEKVLINEPWTKKFNAVNNYIHIFKGTNADISIPDGAGSGTAKYGPIPPKYWHRN